MAQWTEKDIPSLTGKVAIVTGANSGLGFSTALELARHGARVILACRGADKAQRATADISARVPSAQLEYLPLDLADLDSIRAFAEAFKNGHERLDILCNNAGVMMLPLTRTKQGFEMQTGTNHLGHFALTGHLLDVLRATPGSRVISVASMAHRWARGAGLDDLNWEKRRYSEMAAYGQSKLANLLFTFELQRRLQKAGAKTIAVAAHPGYSATNLAHGMKLLQNPVGKFFNDVANKVIAQPADRGALPQLYAATMPDVQGGDYIGPDGFQQLRGYPKKVGCRALARDEGVASQLWKLSEELTGLRYL